MSEPKPPIKTFVPQPAPPETLPPHIQKLLKRVKPAEKTRLPTQNAADRRPARPDGDEVPAYERAARNLEDLKL